MVGAREAGLDRRLVADLVDKADVVGAIVPDPRRAGRSLRRRSRRSPAAARTRPRSVRPRRPPGASSRRRRRRHNRRPSAPGPSTSAGKRGSIRSASRRARRMPSGTGRSPQPEAAQSAPVSTASTPGAAFARRDIDRADARMRMRRAQHMAERHARQHHVVDIAAAAAQQPRILEPRHRLTQREFAHIRPPDLVGYGMG